MERSDERTKRARSPRWTWIGSVIGAWLMLGFVAMALVVLALVLG